MVALKTKIQFLEAQLSSERQSTRKLQEELDEAVRATLKAVKDSDALKSENRALKAEIANLRKQLLDNLKPAPTITTAKERVKERVDAERRKDHARKGREPDTADRSFIQVRTFISLANPSLTRLKNCVRKLKLFEKKRQKQRMPIKLILKLKPRLHQVKRSISQQQMPKEIFKYTLPFSPFLIQTIRIQLENTKDHKDRSGQKSRRRRIRRVIVESDLSDNEQVNTDVENDATSESSDEDYEEEVYAKNKKVFTIPRNIFLSIKSIPIQPWLRPPGQSKLPSVKSEIQNIIDGLAKHNAASCTVCSRKRRLKGKKNGITNSRMLN